MSNPDRPQHDPQDDTTQLDARPCRTIRTDPTEQLDQTGDRGRRRGRRRDPDARADTSTAVSRTDRCRT